MTDTQHTADELRKEAENCVLNVTEQEYGGNKKYWNKLASMLRAGAKAIEREAELSKLVYVPGQWRCAKCKLVVIKAVINTSGDIGMKADAKTETCMNGCGPLWPVTERQAGNELCDRLEQAEARVKELEEVLQNLDDDKNGNSVPAFIRTIARAALQVKP